MPPLRRDRRANTQKLFFEDSFVNLTHFSVKDVPFSIKLSLWPKGPPKRTKWSPRAAQRDPKAVQMLPKDSIWNPKWVQGTPKALQRHPQEAKGEDIYQKTPDQPPKRTLCYIYIYNNYILLKNKHQSQINRRKVVARFPLHVLISHLFDARLLKVSVARKPCYIP